MKKTNLFVTLCPLFRQRMLQIFLIALALAMDCFAVSVACGVIVQKQESRTMLPLAFLFGLFQALMPILGWFLTFHFQSRLEAVDHWIAFGMLVLIGGKMIMDAFREEASGGIEPRQLKTQMALALATSIDAMAVGISFACTGYTSLALLCTPLIVIGFVSFLMSILGFTLGVRFGAIVNRKLQPELLGGLILIGIGIKILIEHLS